MEATARSTPAASRPRSVRVRRDPLALILGHEERWDLISICVVIALALHAAMLVFAIVTGLLHDMHVAVGENRNRLHEFFWRQYDVEVEKPKDEPKPEPPPPEPPPPEPEPAPKADVKQPKEDDPYKDAKPLPAQAAKVVTADSKPDEPVDLGNFTIASGDGGVVGGMQAGDGKGDRVTMNKSANHDGTPGGRGTAPGPQAPPPPALDMSRGVGLAGGAAWNCPFPPEADADQIDTATVGVQVTVRPDGSALTASVVSDPGHGFGRAARICALGRRYVPALNKAGEPIVGSNLVNVRFSR